MSATRKLINLKQCILRRSLVGRNVKSKIPGKKARIDSKNVWGFVLSFVFYFETQPPPALRQMHLAVIMQGTVAGTGSSITGHDLVEVFDVCYRYYMPQSLVSFTKNMGAKNGSLNYSTPQSVEVRSPNLRIARTSHSARISLTYMRFHSSWWLPVNRGVL